jgi:hypothetical protein
MCQIRSEQRKTCTVAVELNRYGAMTLRSDAGQNYQIVASESPQITQQLSQQRVGSRVSVTLTKTPGRGNAWCVTDIERQSDRTYARLGSGRHQPQVEG